MIPFNPFSAITSKIYAALAVIALGFALVQTVRLDGFLFVDGAHDKLAAARARMMAMEQASATAHARAEAQRIATENQSAELARRADYAEAQNATLRAENARLRGVADRFAADRSVQNLRSRLCGPGTAAAPGDAGDRDRQGPDALGQDAVVLTRPEYDEFVANTLRLERVRQWGDSLIREGLAVPAIEFGNDLSSKENPDE